MKYLKNAGLLLAVLFLTLFFSCSARIDGAVREEGTADITLKTSLEPGTITLIRSLRNFMGETSGTPILDGPAISLSLAASPGIQAVSLQNTSPSALAGNILVSNVGDFLSSKDAKSRFITYTRGAGEGTSSIVISLDRDSAPELISRLSPEVEEYLAALMAPVALGETSTKKDYLEFLAQVYGRPLADEIAAARIQALIDFPRAVTVVRGGQAAGKRVEFNIALADILTLEFPLRYEVYW